MSSNHFFNHVSSNNKLCINLGFSLPGKASGLNRTEINLSSTRRNKESYFEDLSETKSNPSLDRMDQLRQMELLPNEGAVIGVC